MTALLERVLAAEPPDFALLHRPETGRRGMLDVVVGQVSDAASLADIPLPEDQGEGRQSGTVHELLVLVPYRQIAERGFACTDDGTPLSVMRVEDQEAVPFDEALSLLPDVPARLENVGFDLDDEDYEAVVRRVVEEEIGRGEGANFVVHRSFVADIAGYSTAHALAFFRRLARAESGAYWTFLIHTGDRTLVGATPERHISVFDGTAVMNPISGTYRYPSSGPTLSGVMDFLADGKETDELYMVVDEELKMMARVCDTGGRVVGPYLKEMGRLAHTEYFIEGHTDRDVRTILRETLFAPTVTGSPLESACRVISRHEPGGRGYYSGVAALIGRDEHGRRTLDSSILIRTADIDRTGRVSIGVGATLVRHSDPAAEAAETRAKAAGLRAALDGGEPQKWGNHPRVRQALLRRNADISRFWLEDTERREAAPVAGLLGRRVLVVDAEDTFTAMIDHQLTSLGLDVTVRRFDEPFDPGDHDLVVMGPGPGDPLAVGEPKIAHLHARIGQSLGDRVPFLAVCLSHQVLCVRLGLDIVRRPTPNQGVQREIDLFGRRVRVGFYNTFAARSGSDRVGLVEVSRDPETGEVHALRGPHFRSMQFHAESLLTEDGVGIMRDALTPLLTGRAAALGAGEVSGA